MARTWTQKHNEHRHPASVQVLDKPYAGRPAGTTMLVATPRDITAYLRSIPRGEARTMEQLRESLASQYDAEMVCPMTTGIFARIAAEFAWEQLEAGTPLEAVAPFWRLIEPSAPLAKRLRCGNEFVRGLREAEGIADRPKRRASRS